MSQWASVLCALASCGQLGRGPHEEGWWGSEVQRYPSPLAWISRLSASVFHALC